MTTNVLSSLKVIARPEIVKSPVLAKRMKLIERLEEQLAMVTAKLANQPFSAFKAKTAKDPESGEKKTVNVPRKIRPWFFDNNGHFYLELKFGGKVLELQPQMPTIDIGEFAELTNVFELIMTATEKGELDEFLKTSEVAENLASDQKSSASKKQTLTN